MSSSAPIARRLAVPNEQERTQIIQLLRIAFINDDAVRCLTGASETVETALYEICMNACVEHGEVWVAGFRDQIRAVSFWIRPGADFHIGLSDGYSHHLNDDMKEWMAHDFTPKYNELYQSDAYPNGQQARVEAWHLVLIGVHPEFRRRGLGKLLVNVVREVADRQSKCITADVQTMPAYHFLSKLGFSYTHVAKNFMSRHVAFILWNMLRRPSQTAPSTG